MHDRAMKPLHLLALIVSLPLLLGGCGGEKVEVEPVAEVKLEPKPEPEPEPEPKPQGVNFLDLNFVGDGRFPGDVILKETGENFTGKAYSTYENGRKKEVATYKDGFLSGIWIRCHENGMMQMETFYNFGVRSSVAIKHWNSKGERVGKFKESVIEIPIPN